MATAALFERFIEGAPVSVMVRSTIEFAYAPAKIDAIFAKAAVRQHDSERLPFSLVYELLSTVVCRQRKSMREAYRHAEERFQVAVKSVYNKLNGVEMPVCRALVRDTTLPLVKIIDKLDPVRQPLLKGYRTRIIDGNHLTSTQHRLEVLRYTKSGPLPGQALVVLDADRKLIIDLLPCEDGEAQERRIMPEVFPSLSRRDLIIADRNFCTTRFLFGVANQGACFIIRQHASTLKWEKESKPKKIGSTPAGVVYEQKLYLLQGEETLVVRRVTIKLHEPTRDGATEIHLLTNLPLKHATALIVAALYLKRWTIENAFQEIDQALRAEIDTLGYPGAALLGFAIACMTYNVLSIVKWTIAAEHPDEIERDQLSSYYLAGSIAADHAGMMIALPAAAWTKRFASLSIAAFIKHLRTCAQKVCVATYKKNVRGEKKPRPKRTSGRINHHVSTAQLIAAAAK
jgi:IS4 transposase